MTKNTSEKVYVEVKVRREGENIWHVLFRLTDLIPLSYTPGDLKFRDWENVAHGFIDYYEVQSTMPLYYYYDTKEEAMAVAEDVFTEENNRWKNRFEKIEELGKFSYDEKIFS
jgi:CRISPR/Cas system-associated exonuclease Cas4 (RecB family)